jgi:hypothetical protein
MAMRPRAISHGAICSKDVMDGYLSVADNEINNEAIEIPSLLAHGYRGEIFFIQKNIELYFNRASGGDGREKKDPISRKMWVG